MRYGQGLQVGFMNDDHIQRNRELLVPHLGLVDVRSDAIFAGRLFEMLSGQVVIVNLLAILGIRSTLRFGA